MASFRIAVDRDFGRGENGERQTDFIDVVAWRATGEFVSKYFAKGRMAVVFGRLQIRPWTDKEGNKRTSAEIVAENVYFGDSKPSGTAAVQRPVDVYADPLDSLTASYPNAVSVEFAEIPDDGELPF